MSVTGGAASAQRPHCPGRVRSSAMSCRGLRCSCGRRACGCDRAGAPIPAWPSARRSLLAVTIGCHVRWSTPGRSKLAKRAPRWVCDVFGELTDFGKSGWFLVPLGILLLAIAVLALAGAAALHAARARERGRAACVPVRWRLRCRACSPPSSSGSSGGRGRSSTPIRSIPLCAVRLAAGLCQPAVRPCHHRVRRGGRDRPRLAAPACADVGLCAGHRGRAGSWWWRISRATWSPAPLVGACRGAAGARLVRGAPARLHGRARRQRSRACRAPRSRASKGLPAAFSPHKKHAHFTARRCGAISGRTNQERHARKRSAAGRFRGRAGQERSRQYRAAGRRDRRRARQPAHASRSSMSTTARPTAPRRNWPA